MTTAFFFAISVAWRRNSSLFCATSLLFFALFASSLFSSLFGLSFFDVRGLLGLASSLFLNPNHPKNQPLAEPISSDLMVALITLGDFLVAHMSLVLVTVVVMSSLSAIFFFLMTMGAFLAHELVLDDHARESRNDIETKKRTKKLQYPAL